MDCDIIDPELENSRNRRRRYVVSWEQTDPHKALSSSVLRARAISISIAQTDKSVKNLGILQYFGRIEGGTSIVLIVKVTVMYGT